MPAGKIVIEYVETDDGSICYLPTEQEVRATKAAILSDTVTFPKEEDRKKRAEMYESAHKRARETWAGRIVHKEWMYRPYTHMDKINAKRAADTGEKNNQGKPIYDDDVYEAHLIAASIGETFEDVANYQGSLYRMLVNKVFAKDAISPEQLDFFAKSDSTSDKG